MKADSDFFLSKWYLDCVSGDGDTFIGYTAQLKWKKLLLHYSSIIRKIGGSEAQTATSLHRSPPPRSTNRGVEWASASLDVKGKWEARSEPIRKRLFESSAGRVEWSCFLPSANAEISFGGNRSVRGLGYAELLEVSIRPWQLPITELQWGRYLSEKDYLVWIDWRGPEPLSCVFLNGRPAQEASVTTDRIEMNSGEYVLALDETAVIRNGSLGLTALSAIPGLGSILPPRIVNAHECKWRSKGILAGKDGATSSGWVIHEIVRFP